MKKKMFHLVIKSCLSFSLDMKNFTCSMCWILKKITCALDDEHESDSEGGDSSDEGFSEKKASKSE